MSNWEVSMDPTTVGVQGGMIRPAARLSKSMSLCVCVCVCVWVCVCVSVRGWEGERERNVYTFIYIEREREEERERESGTNVSIGKCSSWNAQKIQKRKLTMKKERKAKKWYARKEDRKETEKVGMMLHLQLDVLNEGDRARWCISWDLPEESMFLQLTSISISRPQSVPGVSD